MRTTTELSFRIQSSEELYCEDLLRFGRDSSFQHAAPPMFSSQGLVFELTHVAFFKVLKAEIGCKKPARSIPKRYPRGASEHGRTHPLIDLL
jgi:hypothetical protein